MSSDNSETLTGDLSVDFPEYLDPPADPIGLFAARIKRAVRLGVREPLAMSLATVDDDGQPSIRTIVLAEVSNRALIFATHACSRKGRELARNPRSAALLYWRETSEQIAVRGQVNRLPEAVADIMWEARPIMTHAMSVASRQSDMLLDVDELRSAARELSKMAPLPRPANYAAYELVIREVEFWANGTERLHERLVYTNDNESWKIVRLQP